MNWSGNFIYWFKKCIFLAYKFLMMLTNICFRGRKKYSLNACKRLMFLLIFFWRYTVCKYYCLKDTSLVYENQYDIINIKKALKAIAFQSFKKIWNYKKVFLILLQVHICGPIQNFFDIVLLQTGCYLDEKGWISSNVFKDQLHCLVIN